MVSWQMSVVGVILFFWEVLPKLKIKKQTIDFPQNYFLYP